MICAHQVLEHITEPRLFARRVYEDSATGALLHGDVPNMDGLAALVHRTISITAYRFGAITLPHHQFAYEPKTIQHLFGSAFTLKTFDVTIDDLTWGTVNELGPVMKAYAVLSGAFNAGTNLAFTGSRRKLLQETRVTAVLHGSR